MPDLSVGGYLIDALLRLGPVRPTEMGGQRPADWPEIVAFAQGTRRVSEPWEIELLYDLAQDYLAGFRTGSKLFGVAPVDIEGASVEAGSANDTGARPGVD